MNAYAFIYLADVVLTGISKEPVVTIQILDSDRHQRASGCLPLTDKTADKNADENPSRITFVPFQTITTQTTPYYRKIRFSERGRGDEISRSP